MALKEELGLPNPIGTKTHEAVMNIVLTGAQLAKEGDHILRPFGLTESQFNILMLMKYQCPEGEISQTGLGAMLLVNRANVTGLIDRMEQAGWVARGKDVEDRRVKMVRLTPEGRRMLERAEKEYLKRVEGVVSVLSQKDRQSLCDLLEKIRGRLREQHV